MLLHWSILCRYILLAYLVFFKRYIYLVEVCNYAVSFNILTFNTPRFIQSLGWYFRVTLLLFVWKVLFNIYIFLCWVIFGLWWWGVWYFQTFLLNGWLDMIYFGLRDGSSLAGWIVKISFGFLLFALILNLCFSWLSIVAIGGQISDLGDFLRYLF